MQEAEFTYVVGMYGNGKNALSTSEAALVIVAVAAVVLDVVVVVALDPKTPPPVAATAEEYGTVPVHLAPVGQHATIRAASVVHVEPAIQHAPSPSVPERAEQEL